MPEENEHNFILYSGIQGILSQWIFFFLLSTKYMVHLIEGNFIRTVSRLSWIYYDLGNKIIQN